MGGETTGLNGREPKDSDFLLRGVRVCPTPPEGRNPTTQRTPEGVEGPPGPRRETMGLRDEYYGLGEGGSRELHLQF